MQRWASSFSDELAERWNEYVDCQKRLRTEAPFLRRKLEPYKRGTVVDAALGLGCEAIYLMQRGFTVIGNEIDTRLRERAKMLAETAGVDLQTSTADWSAFSDTFPRESVDAVLVLGNSICLLADADERSRVCEQFFMSLKRGGVLIVDQRNFDYMFARRNEILGGEFRYSSRFMYCQKAIEGRPTIIEPSRVRISCFEKANNRLLGYFDVHPFRGNELRGLVESAGFKDVETYFDFRKEPTAQWDFTTLVCQKA